VVGVIVANIRVAVKAQWYGIVEVVAPAGGWGLDVVNLEPHAFEESTETAPSP